MGKRDGQVKPSCKSTVALASFALKWGAAGGVPSTPRRGASSCPTARPRRTEGKPLGFCYLLPGQDTDLASAPLQQQASTGHRRSAEQGSHGGGTAATAAGAAGSAVLPRALPCQRTAGSGSGAPRQCRGMLGCQRQLCRLSACASPRHRAARPPRRAAAAAH